MFGSARKGEIVAKETDCEEGEEKTWLGKYKREKEWRAKGL